MLQKKFKQNDTVFTVVEIDDAVIKLAQDFLAPKHLNKLIFYCDDAYDYAGVCTEKFDLIAVDIFLDISTPNKFRSKSFLQNLKKMLNPNGHLIYNTLNLDDVSAALSEDFYKNTFSVVFPQNKLLRTRGNNMLLFENK